ncbi:hypothetical protein [Pandoraea pnomenusa]|uniref:hypothetical protein n=1 Tax=Pandoraea pnomenusa TaxID=93220 RepID=UPI0007BCD732|nr:hypothetical protein [Pandoraea pnomenusa]ANC46524.1 hypothetical protein A6P55_22430 [Pandoraea pnomenusa]
MAGELGNERDDHGRNANDFADELAELTGKRRRWRITARLDELFRSISLYAVPAAIMLLSGSCCYSRRANMPCAARRH